MSRQQATLENWRISTGRTQNHDQPLVHPNNDQQVITTNLHQSRIDTPNIITSQFDIWGDNISNDKHEDHIRIAVRNINSLPQEASHNKNDLFLNEITTLQTDIYCATEINVAWQNIPNTDSIYERFKGKLEFSKIIYANNQDKDFQAKYQPGGTLILANGNICGRIYESGKEQNTLQRWTWFKIRGKNNKKLVIVNLYRPVYSNGPTSTYQQHKKILLSQDIDQCPRQHILDSLVQELTRLKEEGFAVLVTGDFNEDVKEKKIVDAFSQLQMREIILEQHGRSAPNTTLQGSKPIDGIFATEDIKAINSGYQGFEYGLASDHRLLWVEISYTQVLGTNAPPLWKQQARRLKCQDPQIRKRFNQLRHEYLENHNGYNLLRQIQNDTDFCNKTDWMTTIEQLDTIRCDSIQYGDRHCRKLKMGNIPWSPTIQRIMTRISYLQRCRLKFIKGYEINNRTIWKLYKQTDFEKEISKPDEIIEALKKEFKEYREVKTQASKLRNNFLEQLAENKASEGKLTKEKIYRQLILHEQIRNTFRKIKNTLKDNRKGVTVVEALDNNNEWKVVTEKNEIEKQCIKENISRFTQATDSPPMQTEQIQIFGWKADTNIAQAVLRGQEIESVNIHPELRDMLPYFKTPENINSAIPIRHDITTQEYQRMWIRSREYTSTGTSGIHFGHFQASCQDEYLMSLDKWMLEFSLKTGYSFKRWYNGIDVMIPKKTDSNRVDKLRTIVLMEPDFNFLNKLIGKRVMAQAEKARTIAPEQFGSRKRKSAIIHAVNKQLTTDILRQDKKDFSLMVLDAKSCYDRITPMTASFAMRRQGASNSMIDLMFDTIARMQHIIRTSYGDSEITYQQGIIRFHGILQGNGAGPTIWAMVSSTILDRLRDKGMGVTIELHEQGNKIILIVAFAFVDDTDLLQELSNKQDVTSPQKAVTEWAKGLYATGGLLVGDKCSFQIIRHCWKNNQWVIEHNIDQNINITIPDDKGNNIAIKQNTPDKGELALGIAFSPTGDTKDELNHLRKKTLEWAKKIVKAPINHLEGWIALKTTIFKTIEYALPATILNRKEMNNIIGPALNIGLPKSGICRKISRKIVYAPNKFQGFGLKDPYITQGVKKLELLFNNYNQMTLQLINATWIRASRECGIGPDFLLADFSIYRPIMTRSWITSMWEFITATNIQLTTVNRPYRFRMSTDTYLVKEAFENNMWTNKEKIEFNACRRYLQVETLSDILSANGTQMRKNILQGYKDITSDSFIPQIADTPRPTNEAWKSWKKILLRTYNANDQGCFRGRGYRIENTQEWQWFLQVSTDRIYQQAGNRWTMYTPYIISSRTRNKSYQLISEVDKPNLPMTPVTVYQHGQFIKVESIGQIINTTHRNPNIEWCSTVRTFVHGNKQRLTEFMNHEQIILLSDATVQDTSWAAWIITTPNAFGHNLFIRGKGQIFEQGIDSHRAECFGILGALYTFQQYKSKWFIDNENPIYIVCDNKAALEYACNHQRYPMITSKMPDFDVIQSIRHRLDKQSIKYQHVKGHQDNSSRPWDIFITLNIYVDKLAQDAYESKDVFQPGNSSSYDYVIGEQWQLHMNGQKVYKNIDDSIRNHVAMKDLPQVWHKYNRIQTEWYQEVNWEAMEKAMQKSSVSTRQWIIKRCARDCGANAIRFRRKEHNSELCSFCNEIETVEHVYLCKHNKVTLIWDQAIQDLQQYLESIHTDPNITTQLIKGINNWRQGNTIHDAPMVHDQNQIGWNGILEGTLGRHWMEEQEIYTDQNAKGCNGQKWAHLVIRRLWKIAWEIWNHRNESEHQNDQKNLMDKVQCDIIMEIEQGTEGHRVLQRWFSPQELQRVHNGTLSYKSSWLHLVRAKRGRLQRIQQGSRMYIQMRHTMQLFLGR